MREVKLQRDELEARVVARTMELQEARDSLSRMLDEERKLQELQGRFISTVTHEYRTPLTAIDLSAKLIERCTEAPIEKRQQWARQIQESAERMTRMIDDLLDLERFEKMEPVLVEFSKFVTGVISELQDIYPAHILKVVSQGEVTIQGDERLLRRVVQNLVSNAVKYSPGGSDVVVDVSFNPHRCYLSVRDEGKGIPQEDIPRLFDKFFRAGNAGNIPGTGLGLSIVQRSVEKHQGCITVHSEVGKGTTFVVSFPLEQECQN